MNEIDFEFAVLLQRMTMWEDQYREKKLRGKTEEQLKKDGWWKDASGNWLCKKMFKSRASYLRKDLNHFARHFISVPTEIKDLRKLNQDSS